MEYKNGERVAIYASQPRMLGAVAELEASCLPYKGAIPVRPDGGAIQYYHPKQLRKLKPKAKSVRVTREMLAEAWDKFIGGYEVRALQNVEINPAERSFMFPLLCKELGL